MGCERLGNGGASGSVWQPHPDSGQSMTEAEMINALASAQREATSTVDCAPFAALDREAAYRVQVGVMRSLGGTVGMLKTAVHADGIGVVAPIYVDNVGRAPCRLS